MSKLIAYILIILLGLILPRNKFVTILIFMFMILAAIWAIGNVDYLYYEMNYEAIGIHGLNNDYEIGYQYINLLGNLIGLKFSEFYIIVNTIIFICINGLVFRLSDNPNRVLSLYLIFPFLTDLVQFRNYISLIFVLFAVVNLFKYKRNCFKFIILVLLASTFHITSLFYLSFLLIFFIEKKYLLLMSIVIAVSVYTFNSQIAIFISKFIDISKIGYFYSDVSITTKLLLLTYIIVFSIIIGLLYTSKNESKNIHRKIDIEVIIGVNIILITTVAFVMRDLNFIRIFRNIMIIIYLIIPPFLQKKTNLIRINALSFIFSIIVIISAVWWVVLAYSNSGPISILM